MRQKFPKVELFICLFIAGALFGGKQTQNVFRTNLENKVVVIDPGHGGEDPGKIGINGCLEKDINLAIANYVKEYLLQNGISVVMTRQDDTYVGKDGMEESYHKIDDLKNRVALIEASRASLTVSIHQNSYPNESVYGSQLFYYAKSKEGKRAAEILQQQLTAGLLQKNERKEKANDSYYLLKKTETPTVIVECGFLTNQKEADLLNDSDYQKKVAWNICIGIQQYLSTLPNLQ